MKFTTSYIQTLSHQFQAMTSFVRVTDLDGLQQTWPMTQKVLEVNGVEVPGSDVLPSYDVDIPAFQRSILNNVRPNLSNAVIALLTEPSPQGIALVKQTPVEHMEVIGESEILTETAGRMMMMSAKIYLKLGMQLDVAATYFMSKGPVCAALTEMIKPHLEPKLMMLLSNESSSTLTSDHAITMESVDRAHQARLISSTTKERSNRVLRPTLLARLGKIIGR